MTRLQARTGESTFNLRIDAALKAEFAAAVEAENCPAAEVLRALMRDYVEQARKRRFAEARRQSKLVVSTEEEAEVMRWIKDVSALESGR